jgi:hypothetical protein
MTIRERLERELERQLAAMPDRRDPNRRDIEAVLSHLQTGILSPAVLEATRRLKVRRV